MKNYIAPKSVVLSMNMNENIAASASKKAVNYNNTYWLIDNKIQEIEGLDIDNQLPGLNSSMFIGLWMVAMQNAGTENYLELLQACTVGKA